MRYYVDYSSYFDTHPYPKVKIAKAVKAGGGKNPRLSNKNGWSNQPAVVTFSATESQIKTINNSVEKAIGTPWITINEKDW